MHISAAPAADRCIFTIFYLGCPALNSWINLQKLVPWFSVILPCFHGMIQFKISSFSATQCQTKGNMVDATRARRRGSGREKKRGAVLKLPLTPCLWIQFLEILGPIRKKIGRYVDGSFDLLSFTVFEISVVKVCALAFVQKPSASVVEPSAG